jgi:hypothetical protein
MKNKVRDITPFGLRMPDELKERLVKAMHIAGRRSLNEEINVRLRASLDAPTPYAPMTMGIAEPNNGSSYTVPITDHERQLLAEFKQLTVDKQLALLSLLK